MTKSAKGQSTLANGDTGVLPPIPLTGREQVPAEEAVELHCPKCTGPMIKCQIGYVGIYGWWLERVSRPAGVLGPPRTVTSDVVTQTCVRCGYTELYAVTPTALLHDGDKN
jgi:hypothetical protein